VGIPSARLLFSKSSATFKRVLRVNVIRLREEVCSKERTVAMPFTSVGDCEV
jgi:hypothetical protein